MMKSSFWNKKDPAYLLFLSLFVLLMVWETNPLANQVSREMEAKALDWLYKYHPPLIFPSQKTVFIDIDDYSLDYVNAKTKHWPWSRDVWIQIIEVTKLGDPKLILFDIILADPSIQAPEYDRQLALQAGRNSNLSFALALDYSDNITPQRLPASFRKLDIDIDDRPAQAPAYAAFTRPFSPLWENMSHVHVVNSYKDMDGLFRSTPSFFVFEEKSYPSPALKAAQVFFDFPKFQVENSVLSVTGKNVQLKIPVDEYFRFPLHFYQKPFESVPFANLYSTALRFQDRKIVKDSLVQNMKNKFAGKVVILGSSSKRLNDLKATPIDLKYPGALLHATAISNILEHHYLQRLDYGKNLLITVSLMLAIFGLFTFLKKLIWKGVSSILVLGSYFFLCVYAFQVDSIYLGIATPILFGTISLSLSLILNFEWRPIQKNSLPHRSAA